MLQCKDCTFNSLINVHVSSFLATGHVTFFIADGCSFSNISHSPSLPHRFTSHAPPSIWNSCLIQNSKFYSCPNAQFGVVVTPTQNLMMMMNTSFSHSSETHSPTNGSINSYSSGDVIAYSVHFSDLNDSTRMGLALNIGGNATLNASCCLFEMINASSDHTGAYGAAVSHDGAGAHNSRKCNYTNCTSGYAAGGLNVRSSSLEVVTSCSFYECFSKHYSGLLFFYDKGSHLFKMNTIMNCVATVYSAGMGICFSSKNLSISECYIISCYSSTRHGAIAFVWELESVPGIIATIQFCFFEKNTIGNNLYGCDISTNGANYNSKVTNESFVHSYSLSDCPIRVTINSVDHSDWLGRPPSTIPVVFVSSVFGNDSRSECGVRSQPLVISEGSYIHGTIPVDEMNVSLRGCEFEESTLTSNAVGDGKALFSVSSGILSVSYFTVVHTSSNSNPQSSVLMMSGSGRVTIQFSTIKGEASPATTFSTPLMIVNGGLAELASVCFTTFSNEKQLISFSSPNYLKMSDVTFNTITRQSGNGAIFEAQLLDGNELCLSNVSFADCLCLRGNGGGMQIHMERGSSFSIGNASDIGATAKMNNCQAIGSSVSPSCGGGLLIKLDKDADNFLLKQLAFEGCMADQGNNLFVDTWQLDKLINTTTLEFGPGRNDLDGYAGYERSTAGETLSIPLVVYLWDNMSAFAHVGGEKSADFSRCGYSEVPCSSIMSAVSLWFKDSNRFVELHSPFSLRSELLLDAFGWTIMSRVGKVTIGLDDCNFSGEQAGMIETVSKSALTNFTFALPKSIGFKEALIVCKSSSLSVKECEVTIKQESTNISFLSARGGQVSINQLIMRSTSFDGTSTLDAIFVTDACESFMLNDSIIENFQIRDGSVVKISDCTANVNVSNCTFKGVTCSLGKGGAISMHKPEVVLPCHECLEKCTFEECKIKSDEACGGGVCCCIGMGNHLEITNCAFAACEASVEKKGGFGGGLFLEFDHQDVEFVVSEPSFSQSSPNAAKCGSDLFMKSPSLQASATDSTLPFAKTMADISLDSMRGFDGNDSEHAIPLILLFQSTGSEILASSLEGADTIACGFECYPCASIDQALSRFKTVDKRVITVRTESFVIHEIDLSDVKMISDGEQQASLTMPSAIESGTTMISSKGITQLEQLKIIVPPHISNEVKFVISSSTNKGELSLTNCQIEIEYESEVPNNYIIIKTSGLSIHLVFVTVTNCRMAMPLFSFDIAPPMNAPETAEVQMKNCSFSNITHQDIDSSALFGASLGCGCSMAGCNFSEIFAYQSTNGGAMRVVLEAHGELEITDCNMEECQAENRTVGKGGRLFFDCKQNYGFVFGNLSFNECCAFVGNNIYLKGDALSIKLGKQQFALNMPTERERWNDFCGYGNDEAKEIPLALFEAEWNTPAFANGVGGVDYPLCGLDWYPCSTITYAGNNRFNEEKAEIRLQSSFSFSKSVIFSGKAYEIDAENKGEKVEVEGIEENIKVSSFFEIRTSVAFSKLAFLLPSFFAPCSLNSLFLCSKSTLSFKDVDMEMKVAGLQCKYSLIVATDCTIEIDGFGLSEIEFSGVSAFEFSGKVANFTISAMTMSNIKRTEAGGLVEIKHGAHPVFQNLSSVNSTYSNHCAILVEEACGLTLLECNMSGLKRTTDGGCSVVGVVGNENIIQINGCFFDDIVCSSSGSQGGSLHVKVLSGGELLFDNNSVCRSKVPAIDGDGGGLHITFESVEVAYSLKNAVFEGNDALWGKDIFLNCTKPSTIVDPLLWAGTAERGEEERNKWVLDFTDTRINMTLLRFLFPTDDDIIYVDESLGNEMGSCGSGVNPCKELGFGYEKLGTSKTILHIQNSAWLMGEIDRKEEKLTIRGGDDKSEMHVGIQGHIQLSSGPASTSLTLQNLLFFVPSTPGKHSEVIVGSVGRVSIVSCTFGDTEIECTYSYMWVVRGDGSAIQFDDLKIENIQFGSNCGICKADRGTVVVTRTVATNINIDGDGLFCCGVGAALILNRSSVTNCGASKGVAIYATNASRLKIFNSTFDRCKTLASEGGGINCKIGGKSSLTVQNVSFENCWVDEERSRGGAIFLHVFNDSSNTFSFESLTFRDNKAHKGRDIFVECKSLNESITNERFNFKMFDSNNTKLAFAEGTDFTAFAERTMDLVLFLMPFSSNRIVVSHQGADIAGCGDETVPCQTFRHGYWHIDSSSEEKNILIDNNTSVKDSFDISKMNISSCSSEIMSRLRFEPTLETTGSNPIFYASGGFLFLHIIFSVPKTFVPDQASLISSSSDATSISHVSLQSCSFEQYSPSHDMILKFSLLSTTGGDVELCNCSVQSLHFSETPFAIASSMTIRSCSFNDISAPGSCAGGIMKINLHAHERLHVEDVTMTNSGCSQNNGNGGACFIDCTEAYATEQFLFNNTVFSMNVAKIGKNMYVLSASLNSSITTQAFSFNYSGLINDSNVFVGSDDIFTDTDLFRFLIPYANNTIFVSSSSADVLRCGSEDDPCESFWTGVNHLSHTDDGKQIFIEGVANVDNEYDLSGFAVASASILKEEDGQSEIVYSKKMNGTSGAYVLNRNEMSICAIMLSIDKNFENSADCVIHSEGDELLLRRCAFQSKAADNTEADCSFVLMRRGKLSVDDLEMKSSSVRKSVFVMHDACVCEFHAVKISQCTIDRGCVFESVSSTNAANGIGLINMTDSALSSLTRNDNGGSAIHSTGQNGLIVLISGSQFVDCKAEMSMKGDAVSFCLNDGVELRISDTTMTRCSCSMSGRGGGIHVSTKVEGTLNILFQKMFFTGNTAGVGNDIFILCHNITKQINETQFRFSLKEGVYSSINAIYGSDTTDHMSDTNLMDFITIYESDFIIVSSDDGKNGKNERQCGSAKMPCFSISYACFHLSSDISSMMLVDGESVIDEECILDNMTLTSLKRNDAAIRVQTGISQAGESLITIQNHVTLSHLSFVFERNALASHSSFIFMSSDSLRMESCSFTSPRTDQSRLSIPCTLFTVLSGDVYFSECAFSGLHLALSAISSCTGNVKVTSCSFKSMDYSASVIICDDGMFEICNTSFDECFEKDHVASLISFANAKNISLKECSIVDSHSSAMKGGFVSFASCANICISSCLFENTDFSNREENNINTQSSELCSWNSSLASLERSTASISDTLFSNASHGGLSASGGSVRIVKGEFVGNDPSIASFPSIRRNILCEHNGKLEIDSLKGGDGLLPNTSLWILNEGCELTGMPTGRLSEFFIPSLDAVEVKENGDAAELTFKGRLLIPCNLSFQIVLKRDDVSSIETFPFAEDNYDSENEAKGKISMSLISSAAREEEFY
ncbi:uncharacterized protein MONOS_4134 [Monocercomonoides exilis]|uniref:uncharacterized protein n=1 Tax=Monocercomonoides exilis TaxID=2049356 RepID=UPI00355A46DD|nr:hypothetical protein MONOS_4134 [Monocercomonoides exilis]|eukprot:MONOS_4134.1-p1 / transcript=MONOS_4134.1 / gene=MONOS_4134 / organism=Monocercomonoides_exilis_PA203 / gene_product=unspecified product / transcript_product=unspecified product / location=Mono_scaffold00106:16290-26466(+) / protein_length=3321 / sequence_SO=supercontig / SO=protein_coding / is_pseudo=false